MLFACKRSQFAHYCTIVLANVVVCIF
jgi:hypothetical protein